ncbi:MAG: tyrosine-protein phosphatase [Roseiflexus sp.]|jgi:protein-tyrosine phosphatase|nr:tyrosine-protein phosphatase [Roseiflexus sp.]MBO9335462.1 tyrosine-protein phosphatase [Roseiflexus sp.]MBO9364498.1 tyrosine-protein phosphatase [Roseiflexus sp.]MBO9380908.1 tyrosine-protein phosphatase [Roseiflexus sp.]MBO9388050.1 tyrosine-protein phosphatase [Roseiflexus sp.]
MTLDQRHIPLEGAHNVRDVGGYMTVDGRITRWRRLLRADSLHHLTIEDQQRLRAYGVRTIIDLRLPFEVAHNPNVFAKAHDVHYTNLPLITERSETSIESRASSVSELYCLMLDECQEPIRQILATIAEADAPVLVHCFVGKDRTGLITALALRATGVPVETIADDYALSEALTVALLAEIRAMLIRLGYDVTRFDRLSPAPREAMIATMAYLDERYGGIETYLTSIGLTDAQLAGLRRLLLE